MKKKGFTFLGEETMKLIIAVICIVFLGFLAVSVYFALDRTGKAEQAEVTLNDKDNGIIAAVKSERDFPDFKINSPMGWYIFGFTSSAPDVCAGEKCICICEHSGFIFGTQAIKQKDQFKKCGEKGRCSKVSNLKNEFEIEIEKGKITTISITKSEGLVEIKRN